MALPTAAQPIPVASARRSSAHAAGGARCHPRVAAALTRTPSSPQPSSGTPIVSSGVLPSRRPRRYTAARAQQQQPQPPQPPQPPNGGDSDSSYLPYVIGAALVAAAAVTLWRAPLEDLLLYGDLADSMEDMLMSGSGPGGGPGAGDVAGAALWAVALWFVTPLQLLLLFLGKIETERPSDEIIGAIGRAAKLPVEAVDYEAPTWVRASAVAITAAGGAAMAAFFSWALGDATWSVSTGVGALFAAAIYEVGRPERMSGADAVKLEEQWQDFARFADRRLARNGRCHESEVWAAFRREHARYRSADALSDATLRTMVLNWHPAAERTRNGFYKNLSVQPYVDAFTGQQLGSKPASVVGATAAAGGEATGSSTPSSKSVDES